MALEQATPVEEASKTERAQVTVDGNEAAAYVAYKTNEVMAIYPITPSSPMAELADAWADAGDLNLWGGRPLIQEMQSEAGAAGTVHGSLQSGALTTTFTASQGLLLMIPDMYKIAGELTSTVFHITARSVATHALSIFGDHSDVMATRATGWGMLFSNSVQEVQDFALIAQSATLRARVPFLHVFDGFRTSHEVMKIEKVDDGDIAAMIDEDAVRAHRARSLSPDRPVIRGTAQNPDVFFQSRERANPYYAAAPALVQDAMDRFASLTGRQYRLFDYVGAPDAERVIVLMGSGAETVDETVRHLVHRGERVGMVKVRLFRPFSAEHLLAALPGTVRALAVLDRTKEPGSAGEPLFQDVVTALFESGRQARVIGGRYGLSSKEFTPAMVAAVLAELAKDDPKKRFTVGIQDDVTHLSLDFDPGFSVLSGDVVQAMFWGLGSDGTVGANKNSIKIIGEETDNHAQGYFVYDSKKSGSVTVSHLRFGPRPLHSPYLIQQASFVAVHQFGFLERFPVLEPAVEGATVLLNSPHGPDEVWQYLPPEVRAQVRRKKLRLFVLDAYSVARANRMGGRINTIMQVGFFALSGVLPRDEAMARIKDAIRKSYGKRGEAVIEQNFAAVDASLEHLHEVAVPADATGEDVVPRASGSFVSELIAGRGDALPVSAMPADGTFPTGTAMLEKRNIALEVPLWDEDLCIQCGKCVLVCPHSCIRATLCDEASLANAPEGFKSSKARWKEHGDQRYTLQISAEDCTGCTLCVEVCPAKDKTQVGRKALQMVEQRPIREREARRWEFFLTLPEVSRTNELKFNNVKNVQLLQPLFEFSGACAGCGETPYLKLLSQLFGDRTIIANATGCSSIYGGNLPTTPWTRNRQGRGPAWANSLFEDNAEFGLGMRLAVDQQKAYARRLVDRWRVQLGEDLAIDLLAGEGSDEAAVQAQRARVQALREKLSGVDHPSARDLSSLADVLVDKSVWIVGGDGWAYDIGYGGLDHVLSTGHDVNLLVLDTEVYSNTGGQMSKSTARGAVAKFAAGGKATGKKDLGRMAINYGNVYVAQIAMGANDGQVVKAFLEAQSYPGPSLIIAYSHCIAHGIDMAKGMTQQKLAVESGHWPIYRYDPRLRDEGRNPFQLDCKAPSVALQDYMYTETRYRMLLQSDPEAAGRLLDLARADVAARWKAYEAMASTGGTHPPHPKEVQ